MAKWALHLFDGPNMPAWVHGQIGSAPFQFVKLVVRYSAPQDNPWSGKHIVIRPLAMLDGESQRLIGRGTIGAVEWFARSQGQIPSWPCIVELPNEPTVDTWEQRQALSAFTQQAVTHIRGMGQGQVPGVGVFARGTPQLKAAVPTSRALEELMPVFRAAGADGFLILHEYGQVPMQLGAEWHCLRHRQLESELWALGVRCPPILVTEAGIDGPGGYKNFGINEEDYWAQLAWYMREVERDSIVRAVCPFTTGAYAEWDSFDISEHLVQLMAQDMREHPPVAEPVPVPTPAPAPVEPKESMITIDGRYMTAEQFVAYVEALDMGPVGWVYIHHTASRETDWCGAESLKVLKAEYESKGWTAGPHLFVDSNGIWLCSPLCKDGIGVSGHNWHARHIEIVGNFMDHTPDQQRWRHAVIATAAILKRTGLGVSVVRQHRQAEATKCPGDKLVAVWPDFIAQVEARLKAEVQPLPEDETATDAATLMDKVRWWTEQALREKEGGHLGRAWAILYNLVALQKGLMYRLERVLKEKVP